MGKRLFDVFFAFFFIILLSPVFIFITLIIFIDSGYPVLFFHNRVGRFGKNFKVIKFRSMIKDADNKGGSLTIGSCDSRITKSGFFLRKYKLDELPQLFNILTGQMSFVGPRPETPDHVKFYNERQLHVLSVRPGLTDYASLEYIDESDILKNYTDPENAYINIIMPAKLEMNLKYINDYSFLNDIKLLFKTFIAVLR